MNDKQVQALDLLLDDHFALWDFADSLPEFRPDSDQTTVHDLVALVRKGLIAVQFGQWFENETVPVPQERAEAALLDPANWHPTGREAGHLLVLTSAGVESLRRLGIGL